MLGLDDATEPKLCSLDLLQDWILNVRIYSSVHLIFLENTVAMLQQRYTL